MHDPILEGLKKRRAELVAEVRRCETKFQSLLTDIDHLDATIYQFDPAYKPLHPVVQSAGLTGQVTKTLLNILRKSPEPMSLRSLAIALMMSLGLDHKDQKRVSRMVEQVRRAMARQRGNGTVVAEMGMTNALVWRIAN
jgi:hypothetical protein